MRPTHKEAKKLIIDYGLCHETGKRKLGSRKDARLMVKRVDKRMDEYECEHCGFWHAGHAEHSYRAWKRAQ